MAETTTTAPHHLYFFVTILSLMLAFSCYINYDSMFAHLVSQLKLCVALSPLVLLLFFHFLSSDDGRRLSALFAAAPEQDALHRAGGSPWGVAAALVVLAVMVFYHSSVIDRWFPLHSR